jgi:hypothetical protein
VAKEVLDPSPAAQEAKYAFKVSKLSTVVQGQKQERNLYAASRCSVSLLGPSSAQTPAFPVKGHASAALPTKSSVTTYLLTITLLRSLLLYCHRRNEEGTDVVFPVNRERSLYAAHQSSVTATNITFSCHCMQVQPYQQSHESSLAC